MTIRDEIDWQRRELAYRTNVPVDEIAARYGVHEDSVRDWAVKRGWLRKSNPKRVAILRMRIKMAEAEQALDEDDLEKAGKLLRAVSHYRRALKDIEAMEKELKQEAKDEEATADPDCAQETGEQEPPVEDLRKQIAARIASVERSVARRRAEGGDKLLSRPGGRHAEGLPVVEPCGPDPTG